FLERPFLFREITKQGKYQNTNIGEATWQVRICDLQKCISVVNNKEEELEFNLLINDPIKHYLPDNSIWKGCEGSYIVKLGKESCIKSGKKTGIPLLEASIGAFTRMWLGILPASSLSISDELDGPDRLLQKLDKVFQLPKPYPDWDY
ncbi:MAG: sterol carrier protein domain-containing protein, partial [Actinomycetota bacterium]|nr:sterol carrier protein domain-containing protein [Actinomycetota bacterium]